MLVFLMAEALAMAQDPSTALGTGPSTALGTGPSTALGTGPSTALGTGLPDGPGKAVTVTVCGHCHEAERVAAVRLTREGWQDIIANMVSLGAEATDEELEAILEYLAMNFLGEAPRPLNMNTATNVELESVLQLLRKEAAAIIEYRKKHGKFKSLDDLRKVPGVDFKKIEARKDRLFF